MKNENKIIIKIKKRPRIFRYLRRRIGLDNLAFDFYQLQGRVYDLEQKVKKIKNYEKRKNKRS